MNEQNTNPGSPATEEIANNVAQFDAGNSTIPAQSDASGVVPAETIIPAEIVDVPELVEDIDTVITEAPIEDEETVVVAPANPSELGSDVVAPELNTLNNDAQKTATDSN